LDWLDFISYSEWSAVAAGTILLLRSQLSGLLSQISPTKLDAWGLKAEFERKLESIEAISSTKTNTPDVEPSIEHDVADHSAGDRNVAEVTSAQTWTERYLKRYRNTSPEEAVLGAWRGFERGTRTMGWDR
jgi:hypothetical protein